MSTISHAPSLANPDGTLAIGPGSWSVPDNFWDRFSPLLSPAMPRPLGGRPRRRDDRMILNGIVYLLRTGCHWKALPRVFGPASTVHDRFQEWERDGVFDRAHEAGLLAYDAGVGIEWTWQSADGAMTKAPLGGEKTGPNPTDRGKSGTKRSLLTEGNGLPLAIVAGGANVNDHLLLAETLEHIAVARPTPTPKSPHNLCLDKGYDYPRVPGILADHRYTGHVRSRGEEARAISSEPGFKARRWVVERTHSWLNRFRRLLVRWEKKEANYLALLRLACAWIVFRAAGPSIP